MGVIAVIFALLSLVAAVMGTFLVGNAGAVIAAVLGVVAVALGAFKRIRSRKGGIAPILIAMIAVIVAFSMAGSFSTTFRKLHEKALEVKPDGLWAQASEYTDGGVLGLVRNLPKDEASINAFIEEMNELNQLTEAK